MAADNDPDAEPTLFSAVLTPQRSLGRAGFLAVMLTVGGASFLSGMMFLLAGAWPVVGFFGLDVLLVFLAFRANYRRAAAYEQVIVTPTRLTVRKVSYRGAVQEWSLNPLWVRLEREDAAEYGLAGLALVSRGRHWPIAGFLGPTEKESFAAALTAALGEARRGPTRTVFE